MYGYSILDKLLKYGAHINSSDDAGRTPLHIACLRGDLDLVRYLLQRGANINAIDSQGRVAMDLAVKVSCLIKHWALLYQHKHEVEKIMTELSRSEQLIQLQARAMSHSFVAGVMRYVISNHQTFV